MYTSKDIICIKNFLLTMDITYISMLVYVACYWIWGQDTGVFVQTIIVPALTGILGIIMIIVGHRWAYIFYKKSPNENMLYLARWTYMLGWLFPVFICLIFIISFFVRLG
jgi:hypothetical protein